MSFDRVIGQQRAKAVLIRALRQRRIAHAYLFTGPDGVGKEALAVEFAKALLCTAEDDRPCDECSSCRRVAAFQHPDFSFLFPAPANPNPEEARAVIDSFIRHPYLRKRLHAQTISIDHIRELRRRASLKSMEGRQAAVIVEAEKMAAEAANALLKLLEEPPDGVYLILTSSQADALLPTIVSRCQTIRLAPLSDAEIEWALVEREGADAESARPAARISQGSYRRALEWSSELFAPLRDELLDFLRAALFRGPKTQVETTEELTAKYDKKALQNFLGVMMIWFRDAMMLQSAEEPERTIVNVDRLGKLREFVAAFEAIEFDRALQHIETSVQLIDRNIHPQLVLLTLMTRLRGCIQRKGSNP